MTIHQKKTFLQIAAVNAAMYVLAIGFYFLSDNKNAFIIPVVAAVFVTFMLVLSYFSFRPSKE